MCRTINCFLEISPAHNMEKSTMNDKKKYSFTSFETRSHERYINLEKQNKNSTRPESGMGLSTVTYTDIPEHWIFERLHHSKPILP